MARSCVAGRCARGIEADPAQRAGHVVAGLLERVRPRFPGARVRSHGVHGPDSAALAHPHLPDADGRRHERSRSASARSWRTTSASGRDGWFCLPEVDLGMRFSQFQLARRGQAADHRGQRCSAVGVTTGAASLEAASSTPSADPISSRPPPSSPLPARQAVPSCRRSEAICTPRSSRRSNKQRAHEDHRCADHGPEDLATHERTAEQVDSLREPHRADEDEEHTDHQSSHDASLRSASGSR